MTAPDLVEVVAGVLAGHQPFSSHWDYPIGMVNTATCDCGNLESGAEQPDQLHAAHQARAVLDALAEAGSVYGVRWHVSGCSGINQCTSKRHAERQAARLIESGHGAEVVSRLVFPWTAVEQ